MFGKKEAPIVRINSILGPESKLQGDFTAEGSARVDGTLCGNVKVTGTLIVGATGMICGDVEAEAVIVGGEVKGNIVAPQMVELTEKAKVTGDVTTMDIEIDEQAVLVGKCIVYEETADGKTKLVIPKSVKPSDRAVKRTAKEALEKSFGERL